MDEKIKINRLKSTSQVDTILERNSSLELDLPEIQDLCNLEDTLKVPELPNDTISTLISIKQMAVMTDSVFDIESISEFDLFFKYFEFAQYIPEIYNPEEDKDKLKNQDNNMQEDEDDLPSYIKKIGCKRINPFTKRVMIDEINYLINLDYCGFTIDIPINIVTKSLEKNSNETFVFISVENKKIIKTKGNFLFYLTSGFNYVDKGTYKNIIELNSSIENFKKSFNTDYKLFLKITNGKESRLFWKKFDNSQIDSDIEKYLLEVWRFSENWQRIFINQDYVANKLIKLMGTWIKNLKKRGEKNKRTIVPEILDTELAIDASVALSSDNFVVNSISELFKEQKSKIFSNQINIDNCEDLSNIENLNKEIEDIVTETEEFNQFNTLSVYPLREICKQYASFKEFCRFVMNTEEFNYDIKDFNGKSFELDFHDENTTGDILLIDIHDAESYNRFSLGINSIRNLFDMNGENVFRVFFIDYISNTVMEVLPEYLFQFMKNFDPEMDAGRIDELLDCNRRTFLINKYEGIPIVNVLTPFIISIELVVNNVNDYNFSENISEDIIAVWKLDENEYGGESYQQIYPSNDDEDADDSEEDGENDNNSGHEDDKDGHINGDTNNN